MMTDEMLRRLRRISGRVGRAESSPRLLYLEDVYTPTYVGGTTAGVTTYSIQQGWYWRMGHALFVTGLVVWTTATGTGTAQISLPFAPSATAGFRASGSLRTTTVTFANGTPQLLISPTLALFTMDSPLTNAASAAVVIEAAGNVSFSAFYGVD